MGLASCRDKREAHGPAGGKSGWLCSWCSGHYDHLCLILGVHGPERRSFVRQHWFVSVTACLHLHTTFHHSNNFHQPWFLSSSPQCFLFPEWWAPGDGDHSTDFPSTNVPGLGGVYTEARLLCANLAGHWEHEGERVRIAPGWAAPRHPGQLGS